MQTQSHANMFLEFQAGLSPRGQLEFAYSERIYAVLRVTSLSVTMRG